MSTTVVFQTDFGPGACGAMAGVVKSVDDRLSVFEQDSTIAPFDVRRAAYQLSASVPYWPAGTVFVSVVDREVGSGRRACVARLANGCFVVTPDNGTLTMLVDQVMEVHQIDEARNRLPGSEDVHIFHGRDIFSYTAARLAAGIITLDEVGPAYAPEDIKQLPLTNAEVRIGEGWVEGGIYDFDVPYGSARINVPNRRFQDEAGFAYGDHIVVRVSCGERIVYDGLAMYERTFSLGDDSEGFLCGDIQPGEQQMLRFNTDTGFLQTYAPELLENLAGAVDYVVRIERVDC